MMSFTCEMGYAIDEQTNRYYKMPIMVYICFMLYTQ